MAIDQEQELINRITETVTKNVLEKVTSLMEAEKADKQGKTDENIQHTKEAIKGIIRK